MIQTELPVGRRESFTLLGGLREPGLKVGKLAE